MGMSAVQYKLMPESLDSDLSSIVSSSKSKIEELGGIFSSSEEKEIAFGLKSIVLSFAYPEEKDIDEMGNFLEEIPGVSSAEMIDYRKALG